MKEIGQKQLYQIIKKSTNKQKFQFIKEIINGKVIVKEDKP